MKKKVTFKRDKRTGELYAYEDGKRKGKVSTPGSVKRRVVKKPH